MDLPAATLNDQAETSLSSRNLYWFLQVIKSAPLALASELSQHRALFPLAIAQMTLLADQPLLSTNMSAVANEFGFAGAEKDEKLGGIATRSNRVWYCTQASMQFDQGQCRVFCLRGGFLTHRGPPRGHHEALDPGLPLHADWLHRQLRYCSSLEAFILPFPCRLDFAAFGWVLMVVVALLLLLLPLLLVHIAAAAAGASVAACEV
eukprot:s806_g10.t1